MMKYLKYGLAALALLTASAGAWAGHRGHIHWVVTIGPAWGPWYYPPPYYYPPVVIERVEPPVYIQQPAPAAEPPPPASAYWYYCASAKGYYPYVKECPGGWQKVAPQPPGQP